MSDKPIRWKPRTTWRAKLEKKQEPRIVGIPPKMQKRFGEGTMLIPTPLLVDKLIRKIPEGKLVTTTEIRKRLAEDFDTDTTCPLTTGIFIRIVAEVAEEDRAAGKKIISPYWRVLKKDGSLNEKFPGGIEKQAKHLRNEGHSILPSKGKKPPKVEEFEKSLYKF